VSRLAGLRCLRCGAVAPPWPAPPACPACPAPEFAANLVCDYPTDSADRSGPARRLITVPGADGRAFHVGATVPTFQGLAALDAQRRLAAADACGCVCRRRSNRLQRALGRALETTFGFAAP
jgi:hypothetical protein